MAATIANTLAENNYDVTLFTHDEVNQRDIKKFFGKSLNVSIKSIVKPSSVKPRGYLDFFQTILRSYAFKSKCDIWVDAYSCRVFPWTNISYIHYPLLNHFYFTQKFPYIRKDQSHLIGVLPYALFEKHFTSDDGKLLLANSQYTADEIKKFSGKKATVLYPPVQSTHFSKNPVTLTEKPRKNLVVTISRFGASKKLEKIPYIALLTDPSIQFAIIGRVHYRSVLVSLQKLIKKLGLTDRVKLFTDIPREEMKEMLKSAKIYLHTMVGEHFGISIVEAMAMGCTPVVHDSGGAKEFVPPELRYNSIHEAATRITKETYDWSPKKALKIIRIAEKFREENFSNEFMKLFKQYELNDFSI